MDLKMESGWLIILWIDDNSNKQMGVWKQIWMGSYEWAVMNGQLWTGRLVLLLWANDGLIRSNRKLGEKENFVPERCYSVCVGPRVRPQKQLTYDAVWFMVNLNCAKPHKGECLLPQHSLAFSDWYNIANNEASRLQRQTATFFSSQVMSKVVWCPLWFLTEFW